MRTFRLSPSDFAFLYDECPRCWWLKLRGIKAPFSMPAMFGHIANSMERGITIEELVRLGIPAKEFAEIGCVKSQLLTYPQYDLNIEIVGKIDKAVVLEDGDLGVIDYKTTEISFSRIEKYTRQLHSYQHCIEYPREGAGQLVSLLGLVCFDASKGRFTCNGKGDAAATGYMSYLPIEIDRAKFLSFVDECAALAASKDMPEPGGACATCHHIAEVIRYKEQVHDMVMALGA